jgi:hypothetical protein
MMKLKMLLSGVLLSGSAVYFLDPKRGKARQNDLKDKVHRVGAEGRRAVNVMVRDFTNRTQGVVRETSRVLNDKLIDGHSEDSSSEGANADRMTPALCLLVGGAGLLLSLDGLRKRGMWGGVLTTIGAGMIAKSFIDTEAHMHGGSEAEGDQMGREGELDHQSTSRVGSARKGRQPSASMQ